MRKTNKITDGAMLIAIFCVLTLFNRYTGSAFQEIIIYIMPVPMAAYAVKYGFRDGIPVAVCMAFMSFFMGTPLGIFYAMTEALIGLVFGGCIHAKTDGTKTLFYMMVISAASNVFDSIIFASFFGYDLKAEIAEMQDMMTQAIAQSGAQIPESMLTGSYLLRIMVISMILYGIVSAFITYYVGLAILKRLHFQVEKPKPLRDYYPPKITGYIAIVGFMTMYFTGASTVDGNTLMTALQVISICSMIYLCFFGAVCVTLLVKIFITQKKGLVALITIMVFMLFSTILVAFGFMYLTGDTHERLVKRLEEKQSAPKYGYR